MDLNDAMETLNGYIRKFIRPDQVLYELAAQTLDEYNQAILTNDSNASVLTNIIFEHVKNIKDKINEDNINNNNNIITDLKQINQLTFDFLLSLDISKWNTNYDTYSFKEINNIAINYANYFNNIKKLKIKINNNSEFLQQPLNDPLIKTKFTKLFNPIKFISRKYNFYPHPHSIMFIKTENRISIDNMKFRRWLIEQSK